MVKTNETIIVVVGPTASGKSSLAMGLAQRFGGEIVCADSRTIYRGLDIGTAKPSFADRLAVPHHLIDVIDPDEEFTVAEFKRQAEAAIMAISARGNQAILVGGSGLYVDSILYDYRFPGPADLRLRLQLDTMSTEQLVAMLEFKDPSALSVIDLRNRRRLIRAIETAGMPRSRDEVIAPNYLVLGMLMNKEVAQARIRQRAELMLEQGVLEEVTSIGQQYGWSCRALNITGYGPFARLALGQVTAAKAIDDVVAETAKLYKRQMTWFKRNKNIHWVATPAQAVDETRNFLRAKV